MHSLRKLVFAAFAMTGATVAEAKGDLQGSATPQQCVEEASRKLNEAAAKIGSSALHAVEQHEQYKRDKRWYDVKSLSLLSTPGEIEKSVGAVTKSLTESYVASDTFRKDNREFPRAQKEFLAEIASCFAKGPKAR